MYFQMLNVMFDSSRLQMENKGSVQLEYSWQVLMETNGKIACFEQGGKPSASQLIILL